MHKKGNCIFCSYRFPINTWFICTRYICNFRFCLIHLIKELCIVMRIQVLYTADLKFYAKAVLLTSIITVFPFPVSQWFLNIAPIHSDGIVPDSHRILFCASILQCDLNVITIAHIQFGYYLFITKIVRCQVYMQLPFLPSCKFFYNFIPGDTFFSHQYHHMIKEI